MGILSTENQLIQHKSDIHSDLEELRSQLKKFGAWPEAGDQYLSLMTHALWDMVTIQAKDFDWIPTVLEDVLKGVDIGAQYPSFFQKLLANSELRNDFILKLKEIKHIN